jgi:hypothetical protein
MYSYLNHRRNLTPETFRQINIAIETLQNTLNTNYQNDLKNEQDTFNYFMQ